MIPVVIRTNEPIANLDEIREKQRVSGGRIVSYQEVRSYVVLSKTKTVLAWLPPGQSAAWQGVRSSARTALLGWWSLLGLIATIEALVHNACGGVDVTGLFSSSAPPEGSESHLDVIRQIKKRRRVLGILELVAVVGFFVIVFRVLYLLFIRE